MREWCSCGAAVRASRRDVREWRDAHRCPDRPAPEQHDGPRGADSATERAWQDTEGQISLRWSPKR